MIESLVLRDPAARVPDRIGGSGLGLAVAERSGAGSGAAQAPPPASLPSQPSSPFDRRDFVEIRGNVRPLAPEASVALGASDEEGGGSSGAEQKAGQNPQATLFRQALAVYGAAPPALPAPAPAVAAFPALPATAPEGERRARRLSEAFAPREPESFLGRLLDLAA